MLSNLCFTDPVLSTNLLTLQQQMKSLLQQKLHIQYNTSYLDPKRREQLLKTNEQQRLQLRKVIEKCKLQMVEYFDQQVKVVTVDCVKRGEVVGKNKGKQGFNEGLREGRGVGLIEGFKKGLREGQEDDREMAHREMSDRGQKEAEEDSSFSIHQSQNTSKQSRNSQSTNCKSHIYPSISNQRKSCLSTHSRTTSHGVQQIRASSKSKQRSSRCPPSSSIMNGSLISPNDYSSSQIMQINEFNITSNSHHLPSSSITHHPHKTHPQEQQQSEDIFSLYQQKILCLEEKCQGLERKSEGLLEIVEYQERVIGEMGRVIEGKEGRIRVLEERGKGEKQEYKEKKQSIKEERQKKKEDGGVVERMERELKCLSEFIAKQNSRSLQILQNSPILSIIQCYTSSSSPSFSPSHLPITLSPTYALPSPDPSSFHQPTNNSDDLLQRQEISDLTSQVLELQAMLRRIQQENQELKGERSLLLKRIRICG